MGIPAEHRQFQRPIQNRFWYHHVDDRSQLSSAANTLNLKLKKAGNNEEIYTPVSFFHPDFRFFFMNEFNSLVSA